LKGQLRSLVKPTWSEKMTVLSTFLEFLLNFLFNNLEKHYKISGRKVVSKYELPKQNWKRQSDTKSPIKPTWC